jgi:signal transduction histidine kinase
MSHELRTPFSSFYGLLDLLSGTELDAGQSEIGGTVFGLVSLHHLIY